MRMTTDIVGAPTDRGPSGAGGARKGLTAALWAAVPGGGRRRRRSGLGSRPQSSLSRSVRVLLHTKTWIRGTHHDAPRDLRSQRSRRKPPGTRRRAPPPPPCRSTRRAVAKTLGQAAVASSVSSTPSVSRPSSAESTLTSAMGGSMGTDRHPVRRRSRNRRRPGPAAPWPLGDDPFVVAPIRSPTTNATAGTPFERGSGWPSPADRRRVIEGDSRRARAPFASGQHAQQALKADEPPTVARQRLEVKGRSTRGHAVYPQDLITMRLSSHMISEDHNLRNAESQNHISPSPSGLHQSPRRKSSPAPISGPALPRSIPNRPHRNEPAAQRPGHGSQTCRGSAPVRRDASIERRMIDRELPGPGLRAAH